MDSSQVPGHATVANHPETPTTEGPYSRTASWRPLPQSKKTPSMSSPPLPSQQPGGCPHPPPQAQPGLPINSSPQLLWGIADLTAASHPDTAWAWHGSPAAGAPTPPTSQWKAGKTTLTAVLLARLQTGGQLAGLPLAPGQAVVVSEESPEHWYRRSQQVAFGNHLGWFCRPFRAKPHPDEWLALIDRLAELHAQRGLSLVVIDPLAAFFPARSENDAGSMMAALLPLQRLTAVGLSVLVLHHPGKGEPPAGQAARGSGALSGYADILLELKWYHNPLDNDRRRRLQAFSRYAETPRQLVIEWTADGTDYLSHGTYQEEEFASHWILLRQILEEAPRKLTRAEIRKRLPAEQLPDLSTINRWLEKAVAQGSLARDGKGLRNDPFRYWLPSKEEHWRQDPLAALQMPELFPPPPV